MRDYNARRWLLVALVAAGVSAGLNGRPHPVGAVSPAVRHTPARPWRGERRQVATLPSGLAAVARHTIGPALAGPRLAATLSLSGTWTQQAELTSTAQTFDDGYGEAAAVSGNTAVIGAPNTTPALARPAPAMAPSTSSRARPLASGASRPRCSIPATVVR